MRNKKEFVKVFSTVLLCVVISVVCISCKPRIPKGPEPTLESSFKDLEASIDKIKKSDATNEEQFIKKAKEQINTFQEISKQNIQELRKSDVLSETIVDNLEEDIDSHIKQINKRLETKADSTGKDIKLLNSQLYSLRKMVESLILFKELAFNKSEAARTSQELVNLKIYVLICFSLTAIALLFSYFLYQTMKIRSNKNVRRIPQNLQSPLDNEIYTAIENLRTQQQQIVSHIEQLKSELQNLKQLRTSFERTPSQEKNTYDPPVATSGKTSRVQSPTPPAYQMPQFVYVYNQNPNSFSKIATPVNETEESINNRRLGQSQSVILENKSGGSYWILKEGNSDYLVPKANLRINQHNSTVPAMFECRGYDSSYSRFELLKPARVFPIASNQKWQLEEHGILEFYS